MMRCFMAQANPQTPFIRVTTLEAAKEPTWAARVVEDMTATHYPPIRPRQPLGTLATVIMGRQQVDLQAMMDSLAQAGLDHQVLSLQALKNRVSLALLTMMPQALQLSDREFLVMEPQGYQVHRIPTNLYRASQEAACWALVAIPMLDVIHLPLKISSTPVSIQIWMALGRLGVVLGPPVPG